MNTSEDAGRHLAAVAQATKRLAAAIELENAALQARDTSALSAMTAEKASAARAYEDSFRALRRISADLTELDEGARRQFQDLSAGLAPLVDMNVRLLTIAVEAGRRFMTSVATAAKDLAPASGIYGRDGTTGGAAACRRPLGVAISLDRSL